MVISFTRLVTHRTFFNRLQHPKTALDINVACKVVSTGEDCHNLKQENFCFSGQQNIVKVEFSRVAICGTNGASIDGTGSYAILRGSAIKNVYGAPITITWDEMTDTSGTCSTKTFQVDVDTCADHFNINAYGKSNDGGDAHVFESYMKRNCPFEVST